MVGVAQTKLSSVKGRDKRTREGSRVQGAEKGGWTEGGREEMEGQSWVRRPRWRELGHAMRFRRGGEAEKRCGTVLGFKPSEAVPGCWVSCTGALGARDAPHWEVGDSKRISM